MLSNTPLTLPHVKEPLLSTVSDDIKAHTLQPIGNGTLLHCSEFNGKSSFDLAVISDASREHGGERCTLNDSGILLLGERLFNTSWSISFPSVAFRSNSLASMAARCTWIYCCISSGCCQCSSVSNAPLV